MSLFDLTSEKFHVYEFSGTADSIHWIEILPGKYKGKCYSKESIFFNEVVFTFLEKAIHKIEPNYDHFSVTDIEKNKWVLIIQDLENLALKLEKALNFEEIKSEFNFLFNSTESEFRASFEEIRNPLVTMIKEFIEWLCSKLKTHDWISVIGM